MSGVAHDAGGLGGWSGEADGGGRATILTPELTPLQLVPAGPGSRFLALIIDTALILGVSAVLETLLLATTPLGLAAALGATFGFALSWAYPIWFEVTRQGQTPGKKLLGLRVVDARGLGVGLSQSFVRNIVRTLDFVPLFYGLGLAVALGDRQG